MPRKAEWTTRQKLAEIRRALRASWMRSPMRYEALVRAKVKDGNRVRGYRCEDCGCLEPSKTDVRVDHIVAVGSLKSFTDLPGLAARMMIHSSGLQVLCKSCDKQKRRDERAKESIG